jgi:hypothetical protein
MFKVIRFSDEHIHIVQKHGRGDNALHQTAISAVVKAAPNGRDYYPYRHTDAGQNVANEHRRRLEKMNAVLTELMEDQQGFPVPDPICCETVYPDTEPARLQVAA